MSSANNVCRIYSNELQTTFIMEANSTNPDYTSLTWVHIVCNTVKLVLSGHSKIDKTNVLKTNGSLMKVESIAEIEILNEMENIVISATDTYFMIVYSFILIFKVKFVSHNL